MAARKTAPKKDVREVRCAHVAPVLNVREKPSARAKVVCTVRDGEKVEVLSAENGWAKLENGYCMEEYLG